MTTVFQAIQSRHRAVRSLAMAVPLLLGSVGAWSAVPGITGNATGSTAAAPTFALVAAPSRLTQPDGSALYSWGYGCASGSSPTFVPFAPGASNGANLGCPTMQVPGPTLIVKEGATVTVTLTNNLPSVAGNTSILFPGFAVTASGGVAGTNTNEAVPCAAGSATCAAVTYTFTATKPGTYAYYSGTQSDLQIDMGLFGAVIVLPAATQSNPNAAGTPVPCKTGPYSLAANAYDHPQTCYDREYLFQWHEMSGPLHSAIESQVSACAAKNGVGCTPASGVVEPYRPNYFMINGRSMPDDMDGSYLAQYPNQPYNGNPHMHPGEVVLMRTIGQGRIQHPFHFHGNHARTIARDGNLLLAATDNAPVSGTLAGGVIQPMNRVAGPLYYTIATTSGQTLDTLFTWTAKGLNWDVYGHAQNVNAAGAGFPQGPTATGNAAVDPFPCYADITGHYTVDSTPPAVFPAFDASGNLTAGSPNYGEYCADHNKPIPVTPPDPAVVATGQWYSGTPYLGIQAATPNPLAPTFAKQVSTGGYAYMWHSHDEREITTNNVFPGGMMMMLIIDPPTAFIDETQ